MALRDTELLSCPTCGVEYKSSATLTHKSTTKTRCKKCGSLNQLGALRLAGEIATCPVIQRLPVNEPTRKPRENHARTTDQQIERDALAVRHFKIVGLVAIVGVIGVMCIMFLKTFLTVDGGVFVLACMLGALVGGLIYFIPGIVAIVRGHRNSLAIVMLNLFLGWSFIGWVVALVWSCTENLHSHRDQ